MTTNKLEEVMTLHGGDQLIRPSDYQRLQADHERLQAEYKRLQAECEELRHALFESRANDQQAMAYLSEVRAIVGGDDFPDMVKRVAKLRKYAELWEEIHDEIHRRADREHALADRCHFDVNIMYEDYAAIDAAMQGD